ncbi:transmembrane protein 186 isoform X1 [Seriola aureovittata]|uniref:transmembrane protein 186 isoform X1 n=1 Tax=Seriola aureovittata TaxID=2871759 RepID=UPI0024BEF9E1|nr:transmembrane protein 186 isoform X1 [Seriola aureovittata]
MPCLRKGHALLTKVTTLAVEKEQSNTYLGPRRGASASLTLNSRQIRSVLQRSLTSHLLSCTRRSCLLTGRIHNGVQPPSPGHTPVQQRFHGPFIPKITALVRYSDLSTQKYTMIYTLPYIKLLRAVSRLKLLQTAITVVILPPVYVLYLQGDVPLFLASYTTGIALFAGVMLYTVSHFFRRVVGMMYLDPSQTTLKVSHLTFWGKRHDIYLPVSDVMTISDTGDSAKEIILKLKRYSSPQTLYFSTHYGRVVDKLGFERVFGNLK